MNTLTSKEAKQLELGPARRLYLVSLFSPLILLGLTCLGPAMLLLPLALLILVVVGFGAPQPFVRWHTRQWTLHSLPFAVLIILYAIYYALTVTPYNSQTDLGSATFLCFTIIGACIWYGGNLLGLRQANRGRCWLWAKRGAATELPRPWATALDATSNPPSRIRLPAPLRL